MEYVAGVLGIAVAIGLALLFSEQKRAAWNPRLIVLGLLTQVFLVLIVRFVPPIQDLFLFLSAGVSQLERSTLAAAQFLFGYLSGAKPPFEVVDEGQNFLIAFRVLPLIIVISALAAMAFHVGLIPFVVNLLARLLRRVFGVTGALALGVSGSLFFGTIETPLLIREYLTRLGRAELFALINASMATIAGSVMVLYASVLSPVIDGAAGHLFAASLMSLPAALMLSFIWMPPAQKETSAAAAQEGGGSVGVESLRLKSPYESASEALLKGAQEGLGIVLQIIAALLVLFASVNLIDAFLGLFSDSLTLQVLLGTALQPVAWLLGIPWAETAAAGQLLGTKIVLNEFVSFLNLAQDTSLSEKSRLVLTYALCGFANLGSFGIIVSGLSTLLPQRKSEVVSLTLRSLVVGNLATFMTGAMVGLFA